MAHVVMDAFVDVVGDVADSAAAAVVGGGCAAAVGDVASSRLESYEAMTCDNQAYHWPNWSFDGAGEVGGSRLRATYHTQTLVAAK